MSDRQRLRNLALEMLQVGTVMMKSGSETLAEFTGEPEPTDVHTRVRNELSSAALVYRGLRIDRVPQSRKYEFFWRTESHPSLVLSDQEVLEWASRGPGALTLRIETYLRGRADNDGLEDKPEGEGQE